MIRYQEKFLTEFHKNMVWFELLDMKQDEPEQWHLPWIGILRGLWASPLKGLNVHKDALINTQHVTGALCMPEWTWKRCWWACSRQETGGRELRNASSPGWDWGMSTWKPVLPGFRGTASRGSSWMGKEAGAWSGHAKLWLLESNINQINWFG